MDKKKIQDYVKKRNEVLLKGDVDSFIALLVETNPGITPPPPHIAEISLHKARTAVLSLPLPLRQASKQWLTERGYTALADDLEYTMNQDVLEIMFLAMVETRNKFNTEMREVEDAGDITMQMLRLQANMARACVRALAENGYRITKVDEQL